MPHDTLRARDLNRLVVLNTCMGIFACKVVIVMKHWMDERQMVYFVLLRSVRSTWKRHTVCPGLSVKRVFWVPPAPPAPFHSGT